MPECLKNGRYFRGDSSSRSRNDKLSILIACKLNSACKKTVSVFKKTSRSRLAKSKKAQCTDVHEHFLDEHNAEIGVFLETLNRMPLIVKNKFLRNIS